VSCSRLFEVAAYRDGRIERAPFERHLTTCVECTEELAALEKLADRVREPVATDDLHARRERLRLLEAFEHQLVVPERRTRVWPVLLPLAVGAVFLFVWQRSAPQPAPVVNAPASSSNIIERSEGAAFTQDGDVVKLAAGKLWISVNHETHPRPVKIALPDGDLEDIGTKFTVTVEDGVTQEVAVSEGRVVVHIQGKTAELAAGSVWHPPALPPPSASESSMPLPPKPAQTDEFRLAMAAFDRGDYANAAAKFEHFAQAHPERGEDAAYLRVLSLQRAGDAAGMKAAAADYLRVYPAGFRAKDVERLAQ
jgi:ferric-dicitrate binding protein FerR (iron transport regulator)